MLTGLKTVLKILHWGKALSSRLPVVVIALASCAPPSYIPAQLWGEIDHDVDFTELRNAPDSHIGRQILLGGEVVSKAQIDGSTWLKVRQLPLYGSEAPWWDRTTSEGSFLAVAERAPDVETVMTASLISVVGTVTGAGFMPDRDRENGQAYPVLAITRLEVWPWKLASEDWFSMYWYYYGGRLPFASCGSSGSGP